MDAPQVCIEEFTFSDYDHNSTLVIRYGTIKIRINISAENLACSAKIKSRYLLYLQVAGGDTGSQTNHETEDDFYDWILEGCDHHLLKLPPLAIPQTPTLHDFYNRKMYHFALHATPNDEFMLKDDEYNISQFHSHHLDLLEQFGSLWPSFEASEIAICASSSEEALSQQPREVVTSTGGPYFFKHDFSQRELEAYAKIKEAKLDKLRISRLYGLVWEGSDKLTGLLLWHIGCKSLTLRAALERQTDSHLRQQWIEQLTTTLRRLHEAGVVWGDAKTDNVLIDGENNAWIIDFGGGYTRGWVDENLANTMEGDEQGLSRIIAKIMSE